MRREILYSRSFMRASKRIGKKNPTAADAIEATLQALADDAFHPALKTHKLKGELKDQRSCSGGYDLRIVFELVEHEDREAILLLSVGTHDDVY
ncbi:MAG: type II toxin-antitoxin system mRNA interferase toxin, RelE/StbE family [Planctomycetaceae bacterium]